MNHITELLTDIDRWTDHHRIAIWARWETLRRELDITDADLAAARAGTLVEQVEQLTLAQMDLVDALTNRRNRTRRGPAEPDAPSTDHADYRQEWRP